MSRSESDHHEDWLDLVPVDVSGFTSEQVAKVHHSRSFGYEPGRSSQFSPPGADEK